MNFAYLCGLTFASLGATPAIAAPMFSLVEARLTKVDDISGEPGAPRICIDTDCQVTLDGSFRTTFTVTRKLTGPDTPSTISRVQASAQPRVGLAYYLVISIGSEKPEIEWIGSARNGLCMDRETVEQYGLRSIASRHPCREK